MSAQTRFRVKYRVDSTVQPWMREADAVEAGEIVYVYPGPTYGCIGAGIAVTREPGREPFFEVPRDALDRASDD